MQIPKNKQFDYEKFKRSMWPFPWDAKTRNIENPEEGQLSFEQWEAIFKKPVISTEQTIPENIR